MSLIKGCNLSIFNPLIVESIGPFIGELNQLRDAIGTAELTERSSRSGKKSQSEEEKRSAIASIQSEPNSIPSVIPLLIVI